MIGQKISHYEIVRLIGKGGMGNVYEAIDAEIERRAAIKILKAEYFGNPDVAARFRNEARAVNIIQHSSLVSVYEFGELPDGSAYIVMEYLDGETLGQRMKRLGRIEEAVVIARQICSALCAVHAKRIVHRDLKPANIMLVTDPDMIGGERVKILDFGIAKLMEDQGKGQLRTRTGMVMGSPGYMAPEQYRSLKAADEGSDVYSLGVILFEMVAGRPPFIAPNDAELLAMHMYKEPEDLKQLWPDVTPAVADFVNRMLRKQSKDRPTSQEVLRFLNQQTGLPIGTSMPLPIVKPPEEAATPLAASAASAAHDGATHYGQTDGAGVQPPSGAIDKADPADEVTKQAPTSGPLVSPVESRPAKSQRRFIIVAAILGVLLIAGGVGLSRFRSSPIPPSPIPQAIKRPPPATEVRVADPLPIQHPVAVEPPPPPEDKPSSKGKGKERRRRKSKNSDKP